MKARLLPLYFEGRDHEFDDQLAVLKEQLADEAEFLAPLPLGSELPEARSYHLSPAVGRSVPSPG